MVWNKVKAGEFKGFSIEGLFGGFEQLQSEQKPEEDIINELEKLING